jgi:transcriptional regulator with XRE-family HTH domain
MAQSTMQEYQAERTAFLEKFAAQVRRLRTERGLSQTDLYKKADLHRTEIGRIEGAETEPGLMTIIVLADALGTKLDELVEGLPVPKERKPAPNSKRKPVRTE